MKTRTKRLILVALTLLISTAGFALRKGSDQDVSMVSFEQEGGDSYSTIALRNNTQAAIRGVTF